MIFDLIGDFSAAAAVIPRNHPKHRVLKLLEEAIRRDIYFIDRHPTTIFQCLWNIAWPTSKNDLPVNSLSPTDSLKSREPQARHSILDSIMEKWCDGKSRLIPTFRWMRALDPPEYPLGSVVKAVFGLHCAHITRLMFSSDDLQLISASIWPKAQVCSWNSRTGENFWTVDADDNVTGLAVDRGNRRVVYRTFRSLNVLHLSTGLNDARCPIEDYRCGGVAFLSNGDRIAYGAADGSIHLLSENGDEILAVHGNEAICALASACQFDILASGSLDGTVRIWDLRRKCLIREIGSPSPMMHVFDLEFSPTNSMIVTGHTDGFMTEITLWEIEGQVPIVKRQLDGRIADFTWLSDGLRVALAHEQAGVLIWNTMSNEMKSFYDGRKRTVTAIVSMRNEPFLAVATGSHENDEGARLVLLNADRDPKNEGLAESEVTEWRPFVPPKDEISREARVLHRAKIILVYYRGKQHTLYESSFKRREKIPWKNEQYRVNHAEFSPDGSRFATASNDGLVRIWDATTDQVMAVPFGHRSPVALVRWSGNGTRLVSVPAYRPRFDEAFWRFSPPQSEGVVLRDGFTGCAIRILTEHTEEVAKVETGLVGTGRNRFLTVATSESFLWDTDAGGLIGRLNRGGENISFAGFSPAGNFAYVVASSTVEIASATSGSLEARLVASANIDAIATDAKDRFVAATTRQGVHVWEIGTEALILEYDAHGKPSFSADGERLVLVGEKRLYCWLTSRFQEEPEIVEGRIGDWKIAKCRLPIERAIMRNGETVIDRWGLPLPIAWLPDMITDFFEDSEGFFWISEGGRRFRLANNCYG